jgi:polysaccharide transporter, PST family
MSTLNQRRSGDGGRAVAGIVVTGVAQVWKVGLGFISGIVLARLLTPQDFGIVAMVGPAVALVTFIQDLGLGQATIQKERITPRQIRSLFWVALAASTALAILLALSSGLLARFFSEPAVAPLTVAFAGLVVIWSLPSQPMALLQRKMRFKALAVTDVLAASIGFVVAVIVASAYRSYWALFFGSLATALTTVLLSFAFTRFVPGRPRLAADMRPILGFGGWVTGFNVVNFVSRNADNVLIARFLGAVELGLYERAYKLLLFPIQQVVFPLTRVMLPLLSRRQNDPAEYRRAYLSCITLLLLATQPGIATVIVFSRDVFLLLLGEKWVDAAPIFFWLGISGTHQIMTTTMGWLFLSQGRGREYFVVGAISAVVIVCAFVIGLSGGATGVAMGLTLSGILINAPLAWIVAGQRGPVRLGDLVQTAIPHCFALAAAFAAALAVGEVFTQVGFGALVLATCLAYVLYTAVLMLAPSKRALVLEWTSRFLQTASRFSSGASRGRG